MKIRLQIETSNGRSFSAEHAGPRLRIGQEAGCELVLQGPGCDAVSRQHACIEHTHSGIVVVDLDSADGTLLNDKPLEMPQPLHVDDRIQLGPTGPVLRVVNLDATVGAAVPAGVAPAAEPVSPQSAARPKRFPVVAVGIGIGVGVCILVTLALLALWRLFGVTHGQESTGSGANTTTSNSSLTGSAARAIPKFNAATERVASSNSEPLKSLEQDKNGAVSPDGPNFERREVGRYMPNEKTPSVLLTRPADAEQWGRLRPNARLFSGYPLLSLPGYHSPILLDTGAKLMLWGNIPQFSAFPPILESSVILFVPPAGFDLDFSIDRGRVLLGNGKKSGECRIRLRFLREIWDITLPDENSEAVAELWCKYPPDAPPDPAGIKPAAWVDLFVKGSAKVHAGLQDFPISKNAQLTWTSQQSQVSDPESLPALPDWWTKGPDTKILEVAKAMPVLLDYHDSLGKSSNTLVDDIVTRVREKRDNPRLEATGILILGAIDALPQVIDGLERTDATIRGSAIIALRHWITRGPDFRKELLHALTDSRAGYSQAKAQLLLWLLQGISDSDARRSETIQLLIECLNHENLPLRDLAYRQLLVEAPDIAGAIDYNPTAPEKLREKAVEQWKQNLPTGKVPPRPVQPRKN